MFDVHIAMAETGLKDTILSPFQPLYFKQPPKLSSYLALQTHGNHEDQC